GSEVEAPVAALALVLVAQRQRDQHRRSQHAPGGADLAPGVGLDARQRRVVLGPVLAVGRVVLLVVAGVVGLSVVLVARPGARGAQVVVDAAGAVLRARRPAAIALHHRRLA